ncbi:MFS transporter [Haladaptatus sp. DYSN1]|uniref:MFS transporter n=1 Tax=unclassified Haladaptatus TaxID=2622732 RepID=UPI0024064A8B|nr:MFS transporter [Haladaptatus sp. DYSN1]
MRWPYRRSVLVLCTLAFFGTMVARLVISPVVPAITASFDVTNSAVGAALTGMWMAYALSQFPSGVVADRYGERKVILTAVGLTAAASLLLAFSPSFLTFVVFVVLLGAGAGLHYSPATMLLTRQFDTIGRAIGFHGAGAPAAGLLAPVAAAYVGSIYGWRYALALGALVALPVFAVFAWRVRPTEPANPDTSMRDQFSLGPVVSLLFRPHIAFMVALAVLGAFSWQATASFLSAFFEQYQGTSRTTAGLVFSGYFVVQGFAQPMMGSLSDRIPRDIAVAVCMGAALVGYGLLVVGESWLTLGGAIVCIGIGMSWGAPLQARLMDALAATEQGAGFGFMRTIYILIGALGSVVVGTLSDVAGWALAFTVLAGVMGLGVVGILTNRAFNLGL